MLQQYLLLTDFECFSLIQKERQGQECNREFAGNAGLQISEEHDIDIHRPYSENEWSRVCE